MGRRPKTLATIGELDEQLFFFSEPARLDSLDYMYRLADRFRSVAPSGDSHRIIYSFSFDRRPTCTTHTGAVRNLTTIAVGYRY